MNELIEHKEEIHSCSKCGICQSVCPIYKITGNDCTVSRGQFVMLYGLLKGELKMSKTLNRYLDLCLKCGACSKFCPSGIDVVDIIASAKAEYFKLHKTEKLISFGQKFLFDFLLNLLNIFKKKNKSKCFDKKVIYFGGCGSKLNGNKSVIKLLNACEIEVISPDFDCCGMPFFVRGDMDSFKEYAQNFINKIKKYNIKEIVTTCASCEKTLKSYSKWFECEGIIIKNIYEYLRENKLSPELKKNTKVTFHKPCNTNDFENIEWVLKNTKNLEYIEMKDYNECCGLNGITKLSEYPVFLKLFSKKHQNIINTGAKIVLSSCLGCVATLNMYSLGKYKAQDLTDFLAKNCK